MTKDNQVPQEFLDTLDLLRGHSIRELLHMHDEPLGSNKWVEKVDVDGTAYWRICDQDAEWCVLIEDSDGPVGLGKIIPLPPEEARDVSRSYDSQRNLPVVDAP